MGFPVRSNIFRIGSQEQRFFSRFPIQVAVLFSPSDSEFSDSFKENFLHLDQITGDELAFFAILDPPKDWLEVAHTRDWWKTYQNEVGKLGFSFNDRTLVYEIARRYQVAWDELPALVISTNLWTAEFVSIPTSAGHLEAQLVALTDLAREWERPTMGQIIQLLEDELGTDLRYQPSDDDLRYRLYQIYDVLGTYDPDAHEIDIKTFRSHLAREVQSIDLQTNALNRARKSGNKFEDNYVDDNELFSNLATEIMGRLLPPATVAMRTFQNLAKQRDISIMELLDEESLVMIETSLSVGNLLESIVDNAIPGLVPLRFNRSQRQDHRHSDSPLDFTPGAQGIWKSLEREANLSLIQAARFSRGIEMPAYFGLWRPDFDKQQSKVNTGRNRAKDLNVRDSRDKSRHEFLTLGASYYVTKAMLAENEMGRILLNNLGGSLPDSLLTNWDRVVKIRNKASHISPLSRREYEESLNLALDSHFLAPLMQLKQALRS